MPRSARPRAADVRRIFLLAGECRELGDDPVVWRHHWYAGVARLTDTDLVLGGEKTWPRAGTPTDLGTTEWGWDHGFDPVGWVHAVDEFRRDPYSSPPETLYVERLRRDPAAVLARTDLIADRDWYRSANFRGIQRPIGVDHTVWCYGAIPGGAGTDLNGLILARALGRRDFTARDKAVAREAQAVIAPLVGGPLARFADPAPSALPPAPRRVLKCLLEGDSDKQIAARLGIGMHTVNQYTKAVYRHFGTRGRAELLARWVRRQWGARCAWADPQ